MLKIQNKALLLSLMLLLIAVICFALEYSVYQYVDSSDKYAEGSGVLQESAFLPLGVISFILACLLLGYAGIRKLLSGSK